MSKRLVILAAVALAVVLLGVVVVVPAFAEEPTPTPKAPFPWRGRGFGFGRGIYGQAGLEAAAELLGMTADELSTQLWGGRTLADLADEAGVDLQTLRDAVEAANQAALEAAVRDAIERALEDGYLTQEQADWLLEGLEEGFFPMGRGFGFGHGMGGGFGRGMRGGYGGFAPQLAPSPSTAPSSSSL